jgi:lysophospholipase L1-like esterase
MSARTSRPRRWRALAAVTAAAAGIAGLGIVEVAEAAPRQEAPPSTSAAAPTPTPARPGKPTKIAAIGDSITQATGTGALAQENPKNSWATGWEVDSYAARLGIPTSNRFNYSTNGDRMSDFAPQVTNGKSGGSGDVAPMPADTGLVLVEFGGNDLCRDDVSQMTTTTNYRAQLRGGLQAVAAKAPDALVLVMSVPDIYNLWYIRGAKQDAVYHPEPESNQATGINGARFYWDGLTDLGVKFPCQSLLADPTSYDSPDRARRQAVRQRTKEYNLIIADECSKVLRCRTDLSMLFNLTSNRTSPDGPLTPHAQWRFTDQDISRNTTSGCPIPGLLGGGCGDHFHPSKQGQGKIAQTAWDYGYQWSDTTYPTATATVVPSGRPDGLHRGRATVTFGGTDDVKLRGQEVRVHAPNGAVGPWKTTLGVAPDITITDFGTSYVEVRSFDVNGNRSASTIRRVDIADALAPVPPPAPTVKASAAGLSVTWTPPADDGGATISRYDVAGMLGAPPAPFGSPVLVVDGLSATPPAPPAGEVVRFTVAALNQKGSSGPSAPSQATVAPFASLAAFVDRQYRDFVGRAPTTAELLTAVDALDTGTETPAAFVERLRSGTWFDGAYGPAIRLYRAYFLRLPDPSGLDYWANRRREGRTLAKISLQFSQSSEFLRRYGSLTNAQFIDQIYTNVFGRAPDPSGRDFYLRRLADGWNRGQVVLQFSESSEYKRLTAGLVTVIEYERAMRAKAPSQATVDAGLVTYGTGGASAVFDQIVASASYRGRIFG